ncbi:glycoside hydrolase family 3 C-terminal domain-containing protein [Pelagicoccus albus]|uniref:Glycoside hydrolase family 3 C-terminal domain-containing protein n=2 Tax=Pelagicoccus albus TaxID=415222 RepID=A0A7X1B3L4_9BACT|nr:glycoside hydrolase family 3 C-terminal domain-containing protein [Pelagicoccus albus]
MTLEEKGSLTSGKGFWDTKEIERLGVPSITMTDGPHGLRKSDDMDVTRSSPATCFPTASCLASSWNQELAREVGVALGKECQAADVQILLGPGVNMKRSPLGGRNFEYFSEDPVLSGKLAASFIDGVQSEGVGTSLKHFAANNQEFERMSNDSIVDDQTLREYYLPAFEIAVAESQPWTVMCAYNLVNGVYAAENEALLNGILKKEWGFEGFVVSDWGAVNERPEGVHAGLHLEMPYSQGVTDREVVSAVQSGALEEARLDEVLVDALSVILCGYDSRKPETNVDFDAHHQLARRAAAEGAVLLKNDAILPLKQELRVAVIGDFARSPRYQGAGSSLVNPTRVTNAFDSLKNGAPGSLEFVFASGYDAKGNTSPAMLEEASKLAKSCDLAIVFVGLPNDYESEGFDRSHMDLPEGHNALVAAVADAQSKLGVVLMNGSSVSMPWISDVSFLLESWLGGQAGGEAIADILLGKVNPSGKLSETLPVRLEDTSSYINFPGRGGKSFYGERMFVGYRHFDTVNAAPLYPFGFGLSYTNFEYRGIEISKPTIADGETVEVVAKVANVGEVVGSEIVQLYVSDLANEKRRPVKELKGFAKVRIEPGKVESVRFVLRRRDFASWDTRCNSWVVMPGNYKLLVGGSSNCLPLSGDIVAMESPRSRLKLSRNSMLKEFAKHAGGTEVYLEMLDLCLKSFGLEQKEEVTDSLAGEEPRHSIDFFMAMLNDMPLRKMIGLSGGRIDEAQIERWVSVANQD